MQGRERGEQNVWSSADWVHVPTTDKNIATSTGDWRCTGSKGHGNNKTIQILKQWQHQHYNNDNTNTKAVYQCKWSQTLSTSQQMLKLVPVQRIPERQALVASEQHFLQYSARCSPRFQCHHWNCSLKCKAKQKMVGMDGTERSKGQTSADRARGLVQKKWKNYKGWRRT